MKKITVELTFYEKGDRVYTYEGIGTVAEDEETVGLSEYDIMNRDIKVDLDTPTSHFTNGKALIMLTGIDMSVE